MRCYIVIDGKRLELEDQFFSQYLTENTAVYLDDKMYRVKTIKRILLQSGQGLDSELEIEIE